jgi:2,4-diaminopentanoate dehydrogenase
VTSELSIPVHAEAHEPDLGRPIRAIIYGVGSMGKVMTRMMLDKGVDVVGAVARTHNVGRDLGLVAGMGRQLDVRITDDAQKLLSDRRPDIAVVAVGSYLEAMAPHFRLCLDHGVNVITLEEEAFHPWRRASELARELDALARSRGATLVASGIQDPFWTSAVSTLMACAHRITRVHGRSTYDANEYGPEVTEYLHLGVDVDVAAVRIEGAYARGEDNVAVQTSLEALAALVGLTPTEHESSGVPLVAHDDIHVPALDRIVPKGSTIGVSDRMVLHTHEGIDLEFELQGYAFGPHDCEVNEWRVEGEPNLSMRNDQFPVRLATATTTVNRLPDVIAAPPGLLTVELLPPLRYRHGHFRHPGRTR